MVLEATARTDTGTVVPIVKREYREIGLDLDGRQRMGSWEIKEIIDLSLQPGKSIREKFVTELPAETRSAEVEVKLSLWPSPKREIVVERIVRRIVFAP